MVAEETKRSGKCGEMFAVFIKLKCMELHGNTKFGDLVIGSGAFKDILKSWNRIDATLEMLVETSKVSNLMNITFLFANDKGASTLFKAGTGLKNADPDKRIKLILGRVDAESRALGILGRQKGRRHR